MPMQLTLDFSTKPHPRSQPILRNEGWLDVSDIARGVGFITTVQISIALQDALEPLQNETDNEYDQCIYDALWQAFFQLLLDHSSLATFNFTFPQRHRKTDEIAEVSLRLRVEMQKQATFVGLLQDFPEVT